MSKQVDLDKPLSDADKLHLHERSLDYLIEENERRFKQEKAHAAGQPVKVEIPNLEVPPPPPNPRAVSGQTLESGPVVSEEDAKAADKAAQEDAKRIAKEYEEAQEAREEAFKRSQPTKSSPSTSEDEDVDVDDLTVEELKDNLREFGESTSGSKAELQARLKKAVREAEK